MDKQPASKIKTGLVTFALTLLTFASNPISATQFLLPPNHQSVYEIEKFNTVVGTMRNTLNHKGNKIYYSSVATASGVASLFVKTDPVENSILNWPDSNSQNSPQQLSYEYIQEKKHKKNQRIKFTYLEKGKTHIEGNYKHKPYSLETDKTVWARQFLPLLISNDLQQNSDIRSNNYYIIDKGHIEKYIYTLEADETLKFRGRVLPVLKFKINKQGSRRTSYAWLSKAHYYLPLKIEQFKDSELNIRMLLTQLKLNEDD
jgi:uncharacterized protein DUF3108